QNELVELGVHIITEKDAFIHVSGHPCRDELRQMYDWARPKIAIPVHGEARHLEEHASFALKLGAERSLAPRNGDLIRISPNGPEVIDEVPAGRLHLDGDALLADGAAPMRERRKLSFAGAVFLSIPIDENGALAAPVSATLIGAPRETDTEPNVQTAIEEVVEEAISEAPKPKRRDDDAVASIARRAVRQQLMEIWGKRPLIEIHVCRV
ncbi:MAG: MBL fold metallo-hydrolase RNA specificity domain-containing protein, partial [Pseudomonadota bacterium]